jgi:hypothetical protein
MAKVRISVVMGMALAFAAASSAASPAGAQDASFGCKVLLCAAASNPSWRGITYCVPVMNQLFSLMKRRGFSWPVCSESKTGEPQYEPFEACAQGWTSVRAEEQLVQADPNGPSCARTRSASEAFNQSDGVGDRQNRFEIMARAQRSEPWYVTVDAGDGSRRFYFNVER